ncbi:hypothetical protein [Variovorax sp. PAMC 28711]|uniref:hypothetical protein n=1 Tax=Variovorax sp. PAMC 28711 TaxID=1795631 RepID=UPI00078EDA9C|nr:hypothetical protein [Variovorax sp. PAMC 28711]AMM25145.1 hypothetical protein AX767_12825 [Variovorax sp. PAMC 28711]
MKRFSTAVLIAVFGVLGTACAQQIPVAADCPASAQEMPTTALYGQWEARFDGLPAVAAVRLGKHPDYEGVRGTITRTPGATVAQLAGDIDDEGQLAIDESQDGHRISGVWLGRMEPGSCGKEFTGTWRNAADDSTHPFVLRRTGQSQ